MDNFIKKHLQDIATAIDEIESFFDDQPKLFDSRKIVDARNYIIHGYDSLSVDILWSIVVNHLPLLRQEVDILLDTQSKNK